MWEDHNTTFTLNKNSKHCCRWLNTDHITQCMPSHNHIPQYERWLKSFSHKCEIINNGRGAVHHCKDMLLVNISRKCISCVGWNVTDKLVRNWVRCVLSSVIVIKYCNLLAGCEASWCQFKAIIRMLRDMACTWHDITCTWCEMTWHSHVGNANHCYGFTLRHITPICGNYLTLKCKTC